MPPTGLPEPGRVWGLWVSVPLQTCAPANGTWQGPDGGDKGGENGLKDPICVLPCLGAGAGPVLGHGGEGFGGVRLQKRRKTRWRRPWAPARCGVGGSRSNTTMGWGRGSSGAGVGRLEEGRPDWTPVLEQRAQGAFGCGWGADSEAGGKGQGQCVKGPQGQAKVIGGPELASIKEQAVRLRSATPCSRCASWGKSLDPSRHQFPHLYSGVDNRIYVTELL